MGCHGYTSPPTSSPPGYGIWAMGGVYNVPRVCVSVCLCFLYSLCSVCALSATARPITNIKLDWPCARCSLSVCLCVCSVSDSEAHY